MPNYIRKSGDVKYRKVSVKNSAEPVFTSFASLNESVFYNEDQVVEVQREDGSTVLYRDCGIETAQYGVQGANKFLISSSVPTERLWMRRTDGTGIAYKIPAVLPKDGANVYVLVPSGVQEMELFGDKYFEMVYQLQRR